MERCSFWEVKEFYVPTQIARYGGKRADGVLVQKRDARGRGREVRAARLESSA